MDSTDKSEVSKTKAEIIADKMFIGSDKITSGCGSDLVGATNLATGMVRKFGMCGE
jgi:ATP-dependent Zn protease